MALFLRLLCANTMRKNNSLNLFIQPTLRPLATSQAFVKMPITKYMNNFSEKRSKYVKSASDKSKYKKFYDLIYTGKTDSDIEELFKIIKEDKTLQTNNLNSHMIFKLLYLLDMPDKALEIFNDQELNKVLRTNQQVVELLIAQLEMKKKYAAVVQVFDSFFEQIKGSKDLQRRINIINSSLVDSMVEALHGLNTPESMQKLSEFIGYLNGESVRISNRSLVHLVLFSIEQKKPKFALDQINGLEKGQQMTFLIQNLKCIVHCELNEVGDAFKIIQSLMNKNDRAKLFPETIASLKEAVARTNDPSIEEKFNQINEESDSKNLVLKKTLKEDLEFLIKKDQDRATERWNEWYKNKIESSEENNDKSKSKLSKQFSNGDEKNSKENPENNDQPAKKTTNKNDQQPKKQGIEATKQKFKEISVVKEGQLFEGITRLHKEAQFEKITELVKKRQGSEEFLNGLDSNNLNLIINSLFLTNSKGSLQVLKNLVNLSIKENIAITDNSKVQAFLLACFQSEPNYALGITVLTEIDRISITLHSNLKAIAYLKFNNVEKAMNEISSILELPGNSFTNEGCVFSFVTDMLTNSMKNCKDSDLIMKFKYLNEKIREENRNSILSLVEMCAVSESNKKFVRQVLKENTSDENDSDLKDIFSEYSSLGNGDSKGLVNKIKKYLKKSQVQGVDNEAIESKVLYILSYSIKHDSKLAFEEIKELLNSVKTLGLRFRSAGASLNIFLRLTQHDPVYALEFINEINQDGELKKKFPGLFSNIMCIGFTLIGRTDLAIDQIQGILSKKMKNNTQGKIYPLTLSVLKEAVDSEVLQKRLDKLLTQATNEKRLTSLNIEEIFPKMKV